jgi:ABC-type antimicrobial peptide transport system permease subunit
MHQLDPNVPILEATRLETLVDRATARTRLTMMLVGAAGLAALLLGVVGVYSVLAYGVAGRLREFAVRLALGASPARISGTVLTEGAALAAVGIGGGVILALVAGRMLRALLFEVSPTSIAEYLGAVALLLAVSLAAMLLPATRASRTEPANVLREE